jgi:FKBP-type peptidyl-prolyl cis-trans isomerase
MLASVPLLIALAAAAAPPAAAASTPDAAASAAERALLAADAEDPGAVVLPGVQIHVLKSGPPEGRHPGRSDRIDVRYRGTLPDGRVFSTSPDDGRGISTFALQKLIPAWIASLQLMRPGDVWRIVTPAYLAYGAAGKGLIPPGAVLSFEIELVDAAPTAEAPASGRN